MKRIFFNAICLFTMILSSTILFAQEKEVEPQIYPVKKITFLEVDASINPAIHNYLENNIRKLSKAKGDFIVIS